LLVLFLYQLWNWSATSSMDIAGIWFVDCICIVGTQLVKYECHTSK
jgi:hypothetical protein